MSVRKPFLLLRWLVAFLVLCLVLPDATARPVLAASPVGDVRGDSPQDEPGLQVGPAGETLVASEESSPVAPGVTLTKFDRFDARGWVRGYVLQVDLSAPGITADLLFPGAVAAGEPLSETAARQGAVAGVNADFFDINNTNAPLGAMIQNGELLKGPVAGRERVAGVGVDGIGRLAQVFLEGTVTLPSGEHPLVGLNQTSIPQNGIGLYTPLWGRAPRVDAVGDATPVRDVQVVDGKVTVNSTTIISGPIPTAGYNLIGREAGAEALAALQPGDGVSVTYAPRTDAAGAFRFAVGGYHMLMQDGAVVATDDRDSHPRTAVGFSADGSQMFLVAVDGRQKESRGMTLLELAELMQSLGAYSAMNLDGGGSTTVLAREPGQQEADVVNSPSDGFERSVPNGLGIFAAPGSGELRGFAVKPASSAPFAERVFPGLTRRFISAGYDETYAPVSVSGVAWQALPADVGSFNPTGLFRAKKPGDAVAEAQVRSFMGTFPIRVLGELDRIEADPPRLGLAPGATGTFTVTGYDRDGYAAPIEPEDVTLSYDPGMVTVTPTAQGGFLVTPNDEGAVLVTVRVQGKEAYLPITVGLSTVNASQFEDPSAWTFVKYPAQVGGSLSFGPGRSGQGAQLSYNFATTTATRAAYLQANPLLDLPGQPQRIGLWVNGDGMGAWLRMVVRDAMNTNYTLNLADRVDWTGWRYVETTVPPGVQYPLRLYRIYPVETNKARQYSGQLSFDDLVVKVSPTLEIPAAQVLADPLIVADGGLDGGRWRFAVLSDLHIAGKSSQSKDVRQTREAIRGALEAGAEFIIIGGDFVDTAYPEDFALARQILDEEAGGRVPVYYIPGNHEIMSTGNLENFQAAFGQNRYTFDHKGTRFILLDSATGSFRISDFQQLVEMKAALTAAASDPSIKNVVVVAHHPTRDPMPTESSQLSDQKEARLVEQWLTQFREASGGKGAIYVAGHAHAVDLRRVEGVPYMVLGPVGKTPYGPADQGGFYAWNLFGIDPSPRPDGTQWIRAEVRPILQGISLQAPAALAPGMTATLAATGQQDAGHTFPLRYPASVAWTGSANLFVGAGDEADRAIQTGQYAAVLNPNTRELKAVQAGEVTIRITANGVAAEAIVTIQ
jgi:UDP-2,3-diacylglucosamine pyrophosphatase LpxH